MPTETPRLRIISLGAGVQSTTMSLMAQRGEFDVMPDAAIFADTGWEPKDVYGHLDWLKTQLTFPVHVVSAGNILSDVFARRNTSGGRFASVPWFTRTIVPAGTVVPVFDVGDNDEEVQVGERTLATDEVSNGMGRRQCSSEYKLKPIMHKVRDLLGVGRRARVPAGTVEVWIGMSTDEASRMRDARQRYMTNRWPLVEKNMSRGDCLRWMEQRSLPTPPKSACIGCPFHDQCMWQTMRDQRPEEFAQACEVDAALREGNARGMRGLEFMHPARIPLREAVELKAKADQPNLFDHECEGICGI